MMHQNQDHGDGLRNVSAGARPTLEEAVQELQAARTNPQQFKERWPRMNEVLSLAEAALPHGDRQWIELFALAVKLANETKMYVQAEFLLERALITPDRYGLTLDDCGEIHGALASMAVLQEDLPLLHRRFTDLGIFARDQARSDRKFQADAVFHAAIYELLAGEPGSAQRYFSQMILHNGDLAERNPERALRQIEEMAGFLRSIHRPVEAAWILHSIVGYVKDNEIPRQLRDKMGFELFYAQMELGKYREANNIGRELVAQLREDSNPCREAILAVRLGLCKTIHYLGDTKQSLDITLKLIDREIESSGTPRIDLVPLRMWAMQAAYYLGDHKMIASQARFIERDALMDAIPGMRGLLLSESIEFDVVQSSFFDFDSRHQEYYTRAFTYLKDRDRFLLSNFTGDCPVAPPNERRLVALAKFGSPGHRNEAGDCLDVATNLVAARFEAEAEAYLEDIRCLTGLEAQLTPAQQFRFHWNESEIHNLRHDVDEVFQSCKRAVDAGRHDQALRRTLEYENALLRCAVYSLQRENAEEALSYVDELHALTDLNPRRNDDHVISMWSIYERAYYLLGDENKSDDAKRELDLVVSRVRALRMI